MSNCGEHLINNRYRQRKARVVPTSYSAAALFAFGPSRQLGQIVLPAPGKTGDLKREGRSRARRTARRLSVSDVAELVTPVPGGSDGPRPSQAVQHPPDHGLGPPRSPRCQPLALRRLIQIYFLLPAHGPSKLIQIALIGGQLGYS
jgi:hypothetical protein